MLPIKAGWLVTMVATASFASAGIGYGVSRAQVSATVTCSPSDGARTPHYSGLSRLGSGEVNHTPGRIW
jgi:hypothetical protein